MPRVENHRLPSECIDPLLGRPDAIAERKDFEAVASTILSPAEWRVAEQRVFIHGPKPTLKDVGRILGLSGERVRQIEGSALEKLRTLWGTID